MDLTRATAIRSNLQDALDAATIASAVSRETDAGKIDAMGDKFLAIQFQPKDVTNISGTFVPTSTSIVADATADFTPIFAGTVMKDAVIKIAAHSEVLRDYDSAVTELVLVLDTTASMQGAKMTALKSAANDLVNKVTASPGNKIRIGVVPFGQYVNVGANRRNEPWANVPDDKTTKKDAKCTDDTKTTCETPATTMACIKYKDGVPYETTCQKDAAKNCKTEKTGTQTCTPESTSTSKFNGCVGSPAYPMNVRDSDPPPTRRYPGFLGTTCGAEITPLTPSKTQITKAITALTTSGDTYIPAGLAWGFNALSSVEPLKEADPYDSKKKNNKPRKVLVLMTDGFNTMKMNSDGTHSAITQPAVATQANTYTAELCANIKAEKIEVFTVAFQVTDADTKTLLDNCATDTKHFFDASDSAGLSGAFQKIADALQVVRIAK